MAAARNAYMSNAQNVYSLNINDADELRGVFFYCLKACKAVQCVRLV